MKEFLLLCVMACLISNSSYAQTPVITELCELPSAVTETSGLENGPNSWFWTHNDSGNPAVLYAVDTAGNIQRTVSVIGDANVDWEEITKDENGNIYIGNFGNNSLNRTELRIVKIPSIDTCTVNAYVTDTIRFSYPDQSAFPPNGTYGNFDMEAMFHFQDSVHLFSKDRSNPGTGFTKHYRLPQLGGTYVAELVDSFQTGSISYVFAVTAADISDDGNEVVLLSADKIWLFNNFSGTDFFAGDVATLNLSVFSQKEGICFRNGFLYVTDEASFGLGGKMYRIHPGLFVQVDETAKELEIEAIYGQNLRLAELRFSENESVSWQVFSTDGRLLQEGKARERILASELAQSSGVYVLQLRNEKGAKAMLIQL
ncbi:MAG: hypothetical protein K9J17_08020 [Flavobacteriales bacterium]|nr:hypothetical protein [Flavobacteriales bacterium]